MSAAAAFDAKIDPCTQNLPLYGAAGMRCFHLYNISNRKIHNLCLLYQMHNLLGERNFDIFFVGAVFDPAAQFCFYANGSLDLTFCHNL